MIVRIELEINKLEELRVIAKKLGPFRWKKVLEVRKEMKEIETEHIIKFLLGTQPIRQ